MNLYGEMGPDANANFDLKMKSANRIKIIKFFLN